jgi:hypothetical protein
MPTVRCSSCKSVAPPGAKYCPRCGEYVVAPEDSRKWSAPVPLSGLIFLCALFAVPPMVIVGYALGIGPMVVAGIVLGVILVLILILGMFF